ncbi:MAG TPA: ZIP family metal transporter [Verrucomicrobiae bacterium]|nr:ZIP family metal transporter [Verrucomicrobiae bacterium]
MTEAAISSGWLLLIYCALVLLASLAGGWLLLIIHPTHTRLQLATSFVAGLMLGIALLHFLPDADEQLHSVDRTASWVLAGFLSMFFLQRFFHFHHHDSAEGDPEDCDHAQEISNHEEHDHEHHAHTLADKSAQQLSWVGTALGLTLHSLFDGLALAASVAAGTQGHAKLAGLGVAMVVILHKPFDALAISTLMTASGSSRFSRHLLNILFSLVSPIGAVLFYVGASHVAGSNGNLLGEALAFCAGTFLCIASSDLLPELQFHSHDRFKLSIALLAGVSIAIIIKHFEVSQDQNQNPPPTAATNHRTVACNSDLNASTIFSCAAFTSASVNVFSGER